MAEQIELRGVGVIAYWGRGGHFELPGRVQPALGFDNAKFYISISYRTIPVEEKSSNLVKI